MQINSIQSPFGGLTGLKKQPPAETTGQIASNNQPLFNFGKQSTSAETTGQIASNSGCSSNSGGSNSSGGSFSVAA